MSANPKVRITGGIGEYRGIGYTVQVVGEDLTIEYHTENINVNSLAHTIEMATAIAKQIKELVRQ